MVAQSPFSEKSKYASKFCSGNVEKDRDVFYDVFGNCAFSIYWYFLDKKVAPVFFLFVECIDSPDALNIHI